MRPTTLPPPPWTGWLYAILFTCFPLAAMAWAWAMGAVNVPKWDDHALKGFLEALEQEHSPLGVIRLFLKQHNEHRIVYDRLLVWADHAVFGKLSFTRLMVYGNLSLLGLVAVLAAVAARHSRRWYLLVPPFMLFIISLAQWENFYWALSSIQNFSIVFWVLWSLYALSHRQTPWRGIALATVATLVSGNGFLAWPCGVVVLVAQKRYPLLWPWLGATGLLVCLYFWHYTQPNTHPAAHTTLTETLAAGLAFLGGAADALPVESGTFWPCAALGAGLLLFWGTVAGRRVADFFTEKRATALDAFMLSAVAFMVCTAIVVVAGRLGYGRESLLTSRYRIYSLTLLALTYLYVALRHGQQRTWAVALAGLAISGTLWWSAFRLNAHESLALRRSLLTSQYNWTYTGPMPEARLDATTKRLVNNAPAYYDPLMTSLFQTPTDTPIQMEPVQKDDQNYTLTIVPGSLAPAVPTIAHPDAGLTVLLRSGQRTYLYPALPMPRRHWRVVAGLLPAYDPHAPIRVSIPTPEPATGTYTVVVIDCPPNGPCQLRPTGKLLTVAPHAGQANRPKNW